MITSIDYLDYLCAHSAIMCPAAKSNADIIAAIYGICAAFDSPNCHVVFGDLPSFVQPACGQTQEGSWLDSLRHQSDGMDSRQTSHLIRQLITKCRNSNPIMPPQCGVSATEKTKRVFDPHLFEMIEKVFRIPNEFVPNSSTVSELLAFLDCFLTCKWPPHGYVSGIDDLAAYVCRHFQKPPICHMSIVIVDSTSELSFREACSIVGDLIKNWRKSYLHSESSS